MNNLKEQQFAVKFCVKLGKSATETFAMLNTAYGDVAMKQATCFRWHKRFKNGRPEMGIYRDNLSAITFYRLSLLRKIVWIYRLPLSLLLYILLSPINYRDKQFFVHAVFKLQS